MSYLKEPFSFIPRVVVRPFVPTTRRALGLVALSLLAWHPRLDAQAPPVVETIYAFPDGTLGSPNSALVQDADGNFYGTTISSGGHGTVFQLTPALKLNDLHDFTRTGTDGAYPSGGVVLAADGSLYGVTERGGSNDTGAIYQITFTPKLAYATVQSFDALGTGDVNTYGFEPGSLIQDTHGNLYGTASQGGPSDLGTVFEYTPSEHDFKLVHGFAADDTNGIAPTGGLVIDAKGNLYGTTYGTTGDQEATENTGTAFEIPAAGGFVSLTNFDNVSEGGDPAGLVASLVLGRDGNLYGTVDIGSDGDGAVFQIVPGSAPTVLHSFTGPDGAEPETALVLGKDGNFYGTTGYGGSANEDGEAEGYGTVFKITPKGNYAVLYRFTSEGTDGASPGSALIEGSDGNFYGTTSAGGSGYGTIFVVNVIPTITSAPAATATVGQTFSYQIEATNDPTRYGVAGLPKGLSVDAETGLLSGTPEAAGTHSLTLQAANALGLGTATLTLTIKTPPPVITSAKTATAYVGKAFSYQIIATNNPTSYGVGGLFKGITVDQKTGLITGTPTSTGTHTLTLRAANPGGTGSETLTLTVKVAPPVITSAKTATATVGKAFSYQITATGSPTKYGVGGLFKGITVDAQTGLITGTPTAAGTHSLTLQAANTGGTGTKTLTLTVAAK